MLNDSIGVHRATALQSHVRSEADLLIFGRDLDGSDGYGGGDAMQHWPNVEVRPGYVGPRPSPPLPRRDPHGCERKWEPLIASGRLVHKTLPGTSGVGLRVQKVTRLGTNPNNIWRQGDEQEYDISNKTRSRRAPMPRLPNYPFYEEHIAPGSSTQIVSRTMPAWPARSDTAAHDAPPAPSSLPRSMSTSDIDGAAPRLQASRILGSSIRRHFRTTNEIDDIPGTRSLPSLRQSESCAPGHWRTGGVVHAVAAAGAGGRGNPRARRDEIDDSFGVRRSSAPHAHKLRSEADMVIYGQDLDGGTSVQARG